MHIRDNQGSLDSFAIGLIDSQKVELVRAQLDWTLGSFAEYASVKRDIWRLWC
jgi:hypothetical protein